MTGIASRSPGRYEPGSDGGRAQVQVRYDVFAPGRLENDRPEMHGPAGAAALLAGQDAEAEADLLRHEGAEQQRAARELRGLPLYPGRGRGGQPREIPPREPLTRRDAAQFVDLRPRR